VNKVIHFEIPTGDKTKSRAFYSGVFGWQIFDTPVQMGGGTGTYTTAMTVPVDQKTMTPTEPGAINGAIVDRQGRITAPVLTIQVDSIDQYLRKVTDSGGKVVEGKQTIENMGHYA
jgi:predicted enzyme related to lactoylglutathione lyase